jgi:outer membrane protein OmpA-like peptidoglycan-associated protein
LNAAQTFVDLKGNETGQLAVLMWAANRIGDKIVVAKRLKGIDKDMAENPDFYAAYDLDDRGNLTYNAAKHREFVESKLVSYSEEQQNQGITPEEWEREYWQSFQEKQNEVITNNETQFAEQQAKQAAERKAAEARNNAIERIDATVLDHYLFDEVGLSENQKNTLDDITNLLNQYPDVKIHLTGHTCNIGYKSINLKKGLKRAEAAKEYLVNQGVNAERITVESKGEIDPILPNTSRENREQNRRITFIVEQ